MLPINVQNETSRLRAVVLGSAINNGPTPSVNEAYDPKSLEHILAGTYPLEADMVKEIEDAFEMYDLENKGTISRVETRNIMGNFGYN